MILRHGLRGPLAALGLILAINAFALGSAWYNRQGEPESVLLLTERELFASDHDADAENSGLALRIEWGMDAQYRGSREVSGEKMRELGFTSDGGDYCKNAVSRPVLVVLEHDGPAYARQLEEQRAALAEAEAALAAEPDDRLRINQAERVRLEMARQVNGSRLLGVDVGLDLATLRQRWPDRQRYAIVRAQLRRSYNCGDFDGFLRNLLVEQITVPPALHGELAGYPRGYRNSSQTLPAPRYRIEVAFGQRLEPWVRQVSRRDGP